MRKAVSIVVGVGLLVASVGPAAAKPAKKVHGTFGGTLAPFPKLAAWGDPAGLTKPGCSAGQEDVHWVGHEFTSPGKGNLRVYMEGFTGDHDLYVFDSKTGVPIARAEQAQVPDGAPPEEEAVVPLKPKQTVLLVACNWLGQPEVEAHYEGVFKK
jgi:hypothetical protein